MVLSTTFLELRAKSVFLAKENLKKQEKLLLMAQQMLNYLNY